jgi:hypothetical protein
MNLIVLFSLRLSLFYQISNKLYTVGSLRHSGLISHQRLYNFTEMTQRLLIQSVLTAQ